MSLDASPEDKAHMTFNHLRELERGFFCLVGVPKPFSEITTLVSNRQLLDGQLNENRAVLEAFSPRRCVSNMFDRN